jgi:hypothetical protein
MPFGESILGCDFWSNPQCGIGAPRPVYYNPITNPVGADPSGIIGPPSVFTSAPDPGQTVSSSAIQAFVTSLYTMLYNRQPDAAGLAFWTQNILDQLNKGVALATAENNVQNAFINEVSPDDAADYAAVQAYLRAHGRPAPIVASRPAAGFSALFGGNNIWLWLIGGGIAVYLLSKQ